MRLRSFGVASSWQNLVLSALLCTNVWAKKDSPSVKSTKFSFTPYNIEYFDDSDVVLFENARDGNVYRSENAGESWDKVKGVPEGMLFELSMHPFDRTRAFIISRERTHWLTKDRGETWQSFQTEAVPSLFRRAIAYHAGDPDRIIFNGMDCSGIFCVEIALYTTNGFSKDSKVLRSHTVGCRWAESSELFQTGQSDLDTNRILCVVKGQFSPWQMDQRLVVSDDFFVSVGKDVQEFEPELEAGRTVKGIVAMEETKKYLVVAASAEGTDEMALYISDDTIKWHRAIFPHDHKLTENAYTLLEGTNYSLQIDVMNTRISNPMGVLLSSNSNGTYFTRNIEHTNRHQDGRVDFEKISGVQGIILVNTVDNWEDVEKSGAKKQVKSQISFDDGRTWQNLKVDDLDLHLHSVTELSNSGRVFSSPAPGLVMGVGNTGSGSKDNHLKKYNDGDLFVSDDAGLTWHKALDGPHKYEFGDQGSVIVAIKEGLSDKLRYSLNHGHDWEAVDLPEKVIATQLTTTQDSTSLKFLLVGMAEGKEDEEERDLYIMAIDFDDMHEDQCKSSDMEQWFARVDKDGNPTCLMGHKQSYTRRKASADCFLKKEFQDPEVISTICDCTAADFECDYNFVRSEDRKECVSTSNFVIPKGACEAFGPDDTFRGSSGWRLIPGNDCKRVEGKQMDDLVDRKCVDAIGSPLSGKISHTPKTFSAGDALSKVYLERTGVSAGEDETVVMLTDNGQVHLSHDHGKSWDEILQNEKITQIYPHPYFNDAVFFLTSTKKVFYSVDRGENIRSFSAPLEPITNGRVMSFHPKNKDWIIWIGAKDCGSHEGCHSVASVTQDRGDDGWKTLQRYVRRCEFINELENPNRSDKLIYCEVREKENNNEDNPWQLVSSDDFFNEPPTVHFNDVAKFATMSEFIVVATNDREHRTLKFDASVDGKTFADALFPHGFVVDHQKSYTVLDSSTHSLFLLVAIGTELGLEYGTIIKSNSNGTTYVLSLNGVDSDSYGYVDFEKTFGLEGVAMANVVANFESQDYKSEGKKLKTVMTHNDGAEWGYLNPPPKDADGKKFACGGSLDKCSLHIHGFTERSVQSHTFSSASGIGLMLGVGNVGEYLTSTAEADTFLSSNGGVSWKSAKKGSYMWEFGDQGSIIVIVNEKKPTKAVYYSLDEGDRWDEYIFSDSEMKIIEITTVPSDNSRNFLLWASHDGKLTTINLDFSGLTDKQCKLDEGNVEGGDYYLWTPKHPKQENDCLFGHVSQYHRKKTTSTCYNGRMIPRLHNIAKNCSCTRQDFECDFNFERQIDGTCRLVKGLDPPDHSAICKENPDASSYSEVTGFRRIPMTTCEGGMQLDVNVEHPCPGKEEEFRKKRGPSGVAIFFAIVIPIAVASSVGYWVWRNWSTKFGQIRLGEQSSFSDESPYIKYPVVVVSALVAVAQALPLLGASLWRSARASFGKGSNRRFTTRDSFARGRGDYAVVDEDEGELLGDESDEEA